VERALAFGSWRSGKHPQRGSGKHPREALTRSEALSLTHPIVAPLLTQAPIREEQQIATRTFTQAALLGASPIAPCTQRGNPPRQRQSSTARLSDPPPVVTTAFARAPSNEECSWPRGSSSCAARVPREARSCASADDVARAGATGGAADLSVPPLRPRPIRKGSAIAQRTMSCSNPRPLAGHYPTVGSATQSHALRRCALKSTCRETTTPRSDYGNS